MSFLAFIIWMINIAFDTAGQLSFKAAAVKNSAYDGLAHWKDMARWPWIWMGVAFYVGEFIC